MTRPGALESKKRCHDLLHREIDKGDLLRKSTHFPEDPFFSQGSIGKRDMYVNYQEKITVQPGIKIPEVPL